MGVPERVIHCLLTDAQEVHPDIGRQQARRAMNGDVSANGCARDHLLDSVWKRVGEVTVFQGLRLQSPDRAARLGESLTSQFPHAFDEFPAFLRLLFYNTP